MRAHLFCGSFFMVWASPTCYFFVMRMNKFISMMKPVQTLTNIFYTLISKKKFLNDLFEICVTNVYMKLRENGKKGDSHGVII